MNDPVVILLALAAALNLGVWYIIRSLPCLFTAGAIGAGILVGLLLRAL